MTPRNILKYILASSILFIVSSPVHSQTDVNRETDNPEKEERVRGVQYASPEEAAEAMKKKDIPFISGMSVGGDLAGLIMASWTAYGQYEGLFRIHLKERFFPTFEAGWGISNHTDEETSLHYKTQAPYFRIGCDYNLNKDLHSGNRIFAGLRYAFTAFKYDLDGPDMKDPFGNGSIPYRFTGINSNSHWAEVLFGLEAKIWKSFHIGWNIRYKLRLSQKKTSLGQAWYVPGFGKNDTSTLGGSFNLIFDI